MSRLVRLGDAFVRHMGGVTVEVRLLKWSDGREGANADFYTRRNGVFGQDGRTGRRIRNVRVAPDGAARMGTDEADGELLRWHRALKD
ncbi:MAG: hypothetical protein DCF31_00395 [Alphaproteobacteria bacterium]|nr:MAG: hypothetical protein DCF31_00395 [Alphaproteobacteria bacterium]